MRRAEKDDTRFFLIKYSNIHENINQTTFSWQFLTGLHSGGDYVTIVLKVF